MKRSCTHRKRSMKGLQYALMDLLRRISQPKSEQYGNKDEF